MASRSQNAEDVHSCDNSTDEFVMAMQRAVVVAVPILDNFPTMPPLSGGCTAHKAASSLEEEAFDPESSEPHNPDMKRPIRPASGKHNAPRDRQQAAMLVGHVVDIDSGCVRCGWDSSASSHHNHLMQHNPQFRKFPSHKTFLQKIQ